MSCFAMRRDSDWKINQSCAIAPLEMPGPQKTQSNNKLPCMSSFVFLKRQRMNLALDTTSERHQSVPPHKNETLHVTQNKEDNLEDVSSHKSDRTGLALFGPRQDNLHKTSCGSNSNVERQILCQDSSPKAYSAADKKPESYLEDTPAHLSEQDEINQEKLWAISKDYNLSSLHENESNIKVADFSNLTANDNSPGSIYDSEQHLKYSHEVPPSYPTKNSAVSQDPGGNWALFPNQTNPCGLPYQTVSTVAPYHMSPSTGYITYNLDDGYTFSNTCVGEEIKPVSEARNVLTVNNYSLFCPEQDRQNEASCDNYLIRSDKGHASEEGLVTNSYLNCFSSSESSPHLGATERNSPMSASTDFVPDFWWSRMDHLQSEELLSTTDLGGNNANSGMSSFSCMRDHSTTLGHDACQDAKDDSKTDEDIFGDAFKCKNRKTDLSYIALISKAILSSPERRMLLSDIYDYLSQNYKDIKNNEKAWRNSVRHNLSLNECFVKQERLGRGRGHYWSIHPACIDDFIKGDFRRRQARRRAKKSTLTTDPPSVLATTNAMACTLGPPSGHMERVNCHRVDSFHNALNVSMSISQNDVMTYHHVTGSSV